MWNQNNKTKKHNEAEVDSQIAHTGSQQRRGGRQRA